MAKCMSIPRRGKVRGWRSWCLRGNTMRPCRRRRKKRKSGNQMPKIRVLLTDDHTLFRQGVRRLLETEADFEVVGEASDAGDSVEKARELRPEIVLMDIGMPGLSSFEAARQIRKNRPETKILFLTMYEDEDYLVQCLEVGAAGYVLKDTPA